MNGHRWNAPPGWPAAPEGWTQPAGWQPDPSWPTAPEGWVFWIPVTDPAGIPTPTDPSQATGPVPLPGGPVPPRQRGPLVFAKRHKVWATVIVLVAVSGVGNAASALTSNEKTEVDVTAPATADPTNSPSPQPTSPAAQQAEVKVAKYVTAKDCAVARALLVTSRDKSDALASKATAKDAYAAATNVSRYDLTADGATRETKLNDDLDKVFAAVIARAKAAGPIVESDATDDAVAGCKLAGVQSKAEDAAGDADSAVTRVVALAEEVPWYPKGYGTFLDDGIALKWVDNPNCDYLRCFQVKVVTNKYCNSLYVEVATENAAGEKIGFTNDVLTGLAPGDRGLMTLTSGQDNAQRATVTKVNCY